MSSLDCMSITSSFKFMGQFDKYHEYCPGDVVIKDGTTWVCSGSNQWHSLDYISDLTNHPITAAVEKMNQRSLVKLECSSCGGQLVREGVEYVCTHCNFRYRWSDIQAYGFFKPV